jgi:hypothetical protein
MLKKCDLAELTATVWDLVSTLLLLRVFDRGARLIDWYHVPHLSLQSLLCAAPRQREDIRVIRIWSTGRAVIDRSVRDVKALRTLGALVPVFEGPDFTDGHRHYGECVVVIVTRPSGVAPALDEALNLDGAAAMQFREDLIGKDVFACIPIQTHLNVVLAVPVQNLVFGDLLIIEGRSRLGPHATFKSWVLVGVS